MLLRSLWCMLGARLPAGRTPVFLCGSSTIRTLSSQSLHVDTLQRHRRFYSPDIVKSILKSPAAVPGKRAPKGPRTKQPSRTNQPSSSVDEDTMRCIAFATADQYHLPTLCHDLISHGFTEINLPRDASHALAISTDMAAKPDDNALMFLFRSGDTLKYYGMQGGPSL
ncbi:hypothetical protein CesoFtcFv8_018006 [Champsocephalus esox]|uniref:Uncharacterized protein n=1 Tax=Champsocephalus esox TaxID=159716 RepID=A0AAN8BKM4_9TELE|nr:hypothetical protein CesoFtcFv8_018006 [Champsocephalus esox]